MRIKTSDLNFFKPISASHREEVIQSLKQSGGLNLDFLLLVFFSCVIATFGLILNSPAVIIGAMLVAPLMSPILRCSMALVVGDLREVGRSLATLLIGVLLAVGLSTIFGQLVLDGPFNFLEELPSEVLGRTHPNLFDLMVALAGGAVAAYALAQPHISGALPGVAIATALMPPVCTAGIGLSQGREDILRGALLLFLINFASIIFASSITFTILGFHLIILEVRWKQRLVLLSGEIALQIIVGVGIILATISIVAGVQENQLIRTTLIKELAGRRNSSLVSFDTNKAADKLSIIATVRSAEAFS